MCAMTLYLISSIPRRKIGHFRAVIGKGYPSHGKLKEHLIPFLLVIPLSLSSVMYTQCILVFILFSFWWRCKTKKEEFGGRIISEKKCLIFARGSKSNEYEWGKSCHLGSFSSWELLPYLLFFGDDLVFRWWHAVVGSEAAVESGAKVEARLVFHLVDI